MSNNGVDGKHIRIKESAILDCSRAETSEVVAKWSVELLLLLDVEVWDTQMDTTRRKGAS